MLSRAWLISDANATSDPIAAANDPITEQDTFVWVASGASAPLPVGKSAPGKAYWPGARHSIEWTTGLPHWTTGDDGRLITAQAVQLSGLVDLEDQSVAGSVRKIHVTNLYHMAFGAVGKVALEVDGVCLLPGS